MHIRIENYKLIINGYELHQSEIDRQAFDIYNDKTGEYVTTIYIDDTTKDMTLNKIT